MKHACNAFTYLGLLAAKASCPGVVGVDIASFRLGSHPELPTYLERLAPRAKIRLLIGINGREDTDPTDSSADVCLAVAEEMICKLGKRLEARSRPGCHVKGALIRMKNPKHSVVLLGSANFCTGTYDEFVIPVTGEPVEAFSHFFNVLWAASAKIEPTPLTLSILKNRKF